MEINKKVKEQIEIIIYLLEKGAPIEIENKNTIFDCMSPEVSDYIKDRLDMTEHETKEHETEDYDPNQYKDTRKSAHMRGGVNVYTTGNEDEDEDEDVILTGVINYEDPSQVTLTWNEDIKGLSRNVNYIINAHFGKNDKYSLQEIAIRGMRIDKNVISKMTKSDLLTFVKGNVVFEQGKPKHVKKYPTRFQLSRKSI
jgi:hypothetical protein